MSPASSPIDIGATPSADARAQRVRPYREPLAPPPHALSPPAPPAGQSCGRPRSRARRRAEPRAELALEPPVGRRVVGAPRQRVGRVLLLDDTPRVVVRVQVALAVAVPGRARVVGVPQVHRYGAGQPGADVVRGRPDREVGGVRLRGQREVHHRLPEHDPALGHADQLHRLRRGDGQRQGGRVGHADVLARADDQAARDEPGVLPRLEHPREVVQRRVDVRAADRLDEGADDVVVLVAVLVVLERDAVDGALGVLEGDGDRPLLAFLLMGVREGGAGGGLERRQRGPGVAGGRPHDVCTCSCIDRDLAAQAPPVGHRAIDEQSDGGVVQGLEREQQRAGQQGRHDAERRVLGGRGDEHDPAVLHPGQQRVLLGLAEPVDLVEEQHGVAPVHGLRVAGLIEHRGARP